MLHSSVSASEEDRESLYGDAHSRMAFHQALNQDRVEGYPSVDRDQVSSVGRLLPELDLHGLAQGDFDLALRGLLGEAAPLSTPSIARLKASWHAEYASWTRRRLDELEPVYVWADGIHVEAGLEKGQGGHARRDRWAAGRAEGGPCRGERVSRVDGELGDAAPGSQGPGVPGAAAADR